ncbi:MAG: beta-galactosidase [Methylocystis sp.]|nr:MAG: beta-galactosidase [Methylocystis sp.]
MAFQKLGVCYYPEHWDEALWREDARRMRGLGISIVRIGEFAWSRLEPADGRYDFDWLARAIDVLHGAGLEVVLGTPTATPPKWLADKMPDMLPIDAQGRPRKFGSRRHYCFSHEGYARECDRIVSALAETFGAHPGVVAWQTDNEYGCHDTVESYSPAALRAFRDWCAAKYGTIGALNAAWGNVFWSMELASFDEIELPNLTVTEANPAHRLDFQRFSSDQVVAFNRRQADIIRRFSPGRTILHNFMGSFTAFDHYRLGAELDAAAWDSYPLGFLERGRHDDAFKLRYMRVGDPDYQAFHHDLYRNCGRGRWWVMEQQPGPVNWAPWNPAAAKGAVRMWTYEAFAAGAEVVSYFRWRQAPFAQEQMHAGLLRPDSQPAPGFGEVEQVAREIERLRLSGGADRADVALVFDYESAWAWGIEPQGQDFSYDELVYAFYCAVRRAGLSVDVVPPMAEAVANRRLVLAPGLFAASEDFVAALKTADIVLLGPRTGSKTFDFQIPAQLPPGPLRALVDLKVTRVESLRPGASIRAHGLPGAFERWREWVEPGPNAGVEAVAADGEPALLRQGGRYYLAGWPDEALLDALTSRICGEAELPNLALGPDLRIRDCGPLRYLFNYASKPRDISQLIEGAELRLGGSELEACGVAIYERPT